MGPEHEQSLGPHFVFSLWKRRYELGRQEMPERRDDAEVERALLRVRWVVDDLHAHGLGRLPAGGHQVAGGLQAGADGGDARAIDEA